MSVTLDDVHRMATLARLGVTEDRARGLVVELNTILRHMDVLTKVDTDGIEPVVGIGASGMPLRADSGPSLPLAGDREAMAPQMRDGFFLVPRLSTHESAEASS